MTLALRMLLVVVVNRYEWYMIKKMKRDKVMVIQVEATTRNTRTKKHLPL